MKNIGILKLELVNLERSAETLERIVMNDLTALETLPEDEAEKYEAKVLRKFHRLDELQEEIDATVAKLKEAGGYEPRTYSAKIYEYRPPKYARPKPPKKKPKAERKVYPIDSPSPAKLRARKAKAKPALKPRSVRPSKPRPEPKPRSVRPPKAKPVPKPRKPAQSTEMRNAVRRLNHIKKELRELDGIFEQRRLELERRLEERKAKVAEVANLSKAEGGSQKRNGARKNLENVERQLRELPEAKEVRAATLNEQLETAQRDVNRLGVRRILN